jgi:hypothetical protein
MNKIVVAFACLAACSQQKPAEVRNEARQAAPVSLPARSPPKQALMLPIPQDRAQLERLLVMGYTVHEDHLHAPGVTSCPKMSENPVM